jgi:hypothetical protein
MGGGPLRNMNFMIIHAASVDTHVVDSQYKHHKKARLYTMQLTIHGQTAVPIAETGLSSSVLARKKRFANPKKVVARPALLRKKD